MQSWSVNSRNRSKTYLTSAERRPLFKLYPHDLVVLTSGLACYYSEDIMYDGNPASVTNAQSRVCIRSRVCQSRRKAMSDQATSHTISAELKTQPYTDLVSTWSYRKAASFCKEADVRSPLGHLNIRNTFLSQVISGPGAEIRSDHVPCTNNNRRSIEVSHKHWFSILMGIYRSRCAYGRLSRPRVCSRLHDRVLNTMDISISPGSC